MARPTAAATPLLAFPLFPLFPLLLAWLAHTAAAAFSPIGQWAQTALLLNTTVYVYGGARIGNIGLTNLYTLDLSIPWNAATPPWTDHTSDAGTFTIPVTSFGTMFPAYDNHSFYVWGGGNGMSVNLLQAGFAQYTLATKQWSLPTTIVNMPIQRRELNAVLSSSGIAYIWGGYGDSYTGYSGPGPYVYDKIYNDMITFDTVQLTWAILNITGKVPLPRVSHTSTMLPNDKMVIIGGLVGEQYNASFVNLSFASMADISIFDTNTASWTSYNATGNVPPTRSGSTAVLADDGFTIIIFGGGTQSDSTNMNDVAILNTISMQWSQPAISGVAPSARAEASSVFVNGQMIIFFGVDDTVSGLSDLAILDTRRTPYNWASGFVPNSTATNDLSVATSTSTSTGNSTSFSSSGLSAIGGIGGVVAIAVGSLFFVAVVVFLALCKPWRRRSSHSEASDQLLGGPPPPSAQYYHPSMGQPYFGDSHATLDVQPQYNYSNPQQPIQYIGQPGYGNPYSQYSKPGPVIYAQQEHSQHLEASQSPTSLSHSQDVKYPLLKPTLPEYPLSFKPDEDT